MSLSIVTGTKMSSYLRNLASTGRRCHQALKYFRPCSFYSWAYAALSVFVLCPGTLKGKVAPNDTLMVDDLLMILGTNFQAPFQISWQFFLRHLNRVNKLLNVVTRSRLVLFHCFIPSCPPFGLKLRTKVLSHCTWLSLRQFPAEPFLALFRSRCAFRRTQANSFSCTRSEVDFHPELFRFEMRSAPFIRRFLAWTPR
jgi:hypothetical protein